MTPAAADALISLDDFVELGVALADSEVFHPDRFVLEEGVVRRSVRLATGETVVTDMPGDGARGATEGDAHAFADRAWLTASSVPVDAGATEIGLVDLFSGLGGLSLGVAEAARAVGGVVRAVGVDSDPAAIATYQRNLGDGRGLHADVSAVFDGALGARTTASERAFRRLAGGTAILVGGPPCQGHSAFNNRTRHEDERNALYFTMVRAAEVLDPEHVIIENVPGAMRDRSGVVQRSMESLSRMGYEVASGVVDMAQIGVPQMRRRLVVVASRTRVPPVDTIVKRHRTGLRSVRWAIQDLQDIVPSTSFDEPARSAPQTRERIDVLFERGLWNLPDECRPKCHAGGNHSYGSIYGRLHWEEPAQTITTGFYSMCMGRYVHPERRRTLTAHEAARLQFLPDYVDFGGVHQRGDLARLIGNAVPVKLGYAVALEMLRGQ